MSKRCFMNLHSIYNTNQAYSIFYRSRKVFCKRDEWYFEDDEGSPFGPFDTKEKVLKAVRIYQDVKLNDVQLSDGSMKRVIA